MNRFPQSNCESSGQNFIPLLLDVFFVYFRYKIIAPSYNDILFIIMIA